MLSELPLNRAPTRWSSHWIGLYRAPTKQCFPRISSYCKATAIAALDVDENAQRHPAEEAS